jgi:hypothetical protein
MSQLLPKESSANHRTTELAWAEPRADAAPLKTAWRFDRFHSLAPPVVGDGRAAKGVMGDNCFAGALTPVSCSADKSA